MSFALQAGTAIIDITPPLGGSLAGFMNDRRSTRVHDPLHVRCLVLDNGQERLAIAVCDLVAIAGQQVAQARHLIHGHTGIPLSNILISAVHTHTAATPAPLFQSDPDPTYLEWLPTRIADGVRSAAANLHPARIGWGVGRESSLLFNRRYFMKPGTIPNNPFDEPTDRVKMNPGNVNPDIVKPAGPVDPDLSLLALTYDDGEPMALLGSYALHYVGNNPETDISADYFGMWAEEVAALLGSPRPLDGDRAPFLPILANACSANVNNVDVSRPFKQPYPYHQMRKAARIVAAEAAKVWPQIEFRDWVPLGAREEKIDVRVRRPSAADVDRAKGILAKAGPVLKGFTQVYAYETFKMADWPEKVPSLVQAMRVGDVGIAAFPGEMFVELGLELKKRSPLAQTLCIELANDYRGYFPNAQGYEDGGYETWRARSAFAEKGSGEKLVETALRLLNELSALSAETKPA